MSEYTVI